MTSAMDIGVVLQTTRRRRAVVELAKRAETLRVQPRLDVRLPHPVAGAVRHLQPDPRRDPQHHRRADGHQPGDPRLDGHGQRCSPRSTRCTATARSAASAAATRRCASRTASRPRSPRCASRSHVIRELANGRSVEYNGSTITFPWAARSELEVWVAGYGPEGAGADRRGRRRLHPAARRPADRGVDDRGGPRAPPSAPAATPTTITICVAAPAYVGDDLAAPARPVPLVRRDGRQPRRRHRRPLRRRSPTCPAALTDYITGRQGYDYNQHGQAGNTHADFVPDEIVDRFCILGPVDEHVASPARSCATLGVDQFAVYLQHDGKDATLQAYGEHVIPAPHRDGSPA